MSGYIGNSAGVVSITSPDLDAKYVDAAGDTMTGNLSFGDNDKAIFGAGSDLQIYSDGTHSRIYESGSGLLIVRASNFNVNNADGTDSYITMQDGGAVTAYYDGSAKIATTLTGIDVTGTVINDGVTVGSYQGTAVNAPLNLKSDTNHHGLSIEENIGTETWQLGVDVDGDLNFYNSGSATPSVTFDDIGNVGIGTTAPTALLHLKTTAASAKLAFETTGGTVPRTWLNFVSDSSGSYFIQDSTASANRLTIDTSGNVGIGTTTPQNTLDLSSTSPQIRLDDTDAIGYSKISGSGGNVYLQADEGNTVASSAIIMKVDAAEAMRIDSSGNVLVGKTAVGDTVGCQLESVGVAKFIASGSKALIADRNTNDGDVAQFRRQAVTVGSISVTASATAYNTSSDYRLKENITPIQGASDIVKQMRPSTYTFKSDGSWHDGFLAHELQELHPRAVTGSKDAMKDEEYEVTPAVLDEDGAVVTEAVMGTRSVPDYQGVDYSKLTPILTAALQEALTKIDTLEAQNATFEARLAALEAV